MDEAISHQNIKLDKIAEDNSITGLKEIILDFLCSNEEIFFKSQQIDDPELTREEKRAIASDILQENHLTFLSRFGKFLSSEHLIYFELKANTEMNMDDGNNAAVNNYDIKYLLKQLRKNLERKKLNVKNRRYTYMNELIKENKYFSEKEMMLREPYLYEHLIGQYLSEAEKRERDGYDPKNTLLTNILFDSIDKEYMENLRKEQQNEEGNNKMDIYDSSIGDDDSDSLKSINKIYWGDIDESRENARSSSTSKEITDGEREMLRNEFIGIMFSKFLNGEDKDFDYSKIDNNEDLDDLKQINQDDEDKYFDESDEDDI